MCSIATTSAWDGARLVVFPECFLSAYPSGAWAAAAATWADGCDELWERMWASSVEGVGRVGGLICWENRMPLARWAVYQGGPQIWLAPNADDSEGWIVSMRHIAIEAGAFVVSVPQYIPASAFPIDFPLPLPAGVEVFGRGGACIVAPSGDVIAGPLYDAEGIVVADCDLRDALHAKRYFDVVGHYGRQDVLSHRLPEAD